jgi:hypothetical protein
MLRCQEEIDRGYSEASKQANKQTNHPISQPTNTQKVIPWGKIHFETLTFLQAFKKFPPFYGIRSTFTSTLNLSVS